MKFDTVYLHFMHLSITVINNSPPNLGILLKILFMKIGSYGNTIKYSKKNCAFCDV